MKPRCPYCTAGRIAVELGSSLTYPCPDCRNVTTAQDTYGGVLVIDPRDCDDRDHVETEKTKE